MKTVTRSGAPNRVGVRKPDDVLNCRIMVLCAKRNVHQNVPMPKLSPTQTRVIAVAVFDGVQGLDVFGPLDAFDAANGFAAGAYRLELWSLHGAVVRTESGLRLVADCALGARRRADTLILPGGAGARSIVLAEKMQLTLASVANRSRRLVSVCTGAFLACRFVPDGTRVATHWKYVEDLRERFPAHQPDGDSLYLRDGRLWSSAGVTAGIDLALKLIADDLGESIAVACARQLVVHYHRAGNQAQFSEPLRLQQRSAGEFGKLLAWMIGHPQADLSVHALAERAGVSPRHLTRKFSAAFGESPGKFVERLRLDHARSLLGQGIRVDGAARAAGFRSADAFRRAFERRFSVAPSAYRRRFGAAAVGERHNDQS